MARLVTGLWSAAELLTLLVAVGLFGWWLRRDFDNGGERRWR